MVVELSPAGLRIRRPLVGATRRRIVQLEFEIPEVDELVWAQGEICFDQIHRVPSVTGLGQVVRESGIRLLATTSRHRRMLREIVYDTVAAERAAQQQTTDDWAVRAACYRS